MPGHVALIRLRLSKLSRHAPGLSLAALLMRPANTVSAWANALTLASDGFTRLQLFALLNLDVTQPQFGGCFRVGIGGNTNNLASRAKPCKYFTSRICLCRLVAEEIGSDLRPP
jgi:hypothetical protein